MSRFADRKDRMCHTLVTSSGEIFSVDVEDVKHIYEFPAQGEGDKWYYEIIFGDGYAKRVFEFAQSHWMPVGVECRPGGYLVRNENGDASFVEGDDFESRYEASDGQTSEEGT